MWTWPQFGQIGRPTRECRYICEDCTRAAYGHSPYDDDCESFSCVIFVRLKDPPPEVLAAKAVKKAAAKKTREPKAPTPICGLCRRKGHTYSECPLIKPIGREVNIDGT